MKVLGNELFLNYEQISSDTTDDEEINNNNCLGKEEPSTENEEINLEDLTYYPDV